jgi:hypothetical protein
MAEVPADQQNEFLFMQVVMMFQGMAMQNLGKVMNPVTNQIDRNLDQAKNMIDLLGMLDAKTEGNLNSNEKNLLTHALYELRMNYVDEVKKGSAQAEDPAATQENPEAGGEPEQAEDAAATQENPETSGEPEQAEESAGESEDKS